MILWSDEHSLENNKKSYFYKHFRIVLLAWNRFSKLAVYRPSLFQSKIQIMGKVNNRNRRFNKE